MNLCLLDSVVNGGTKPSSSLGSKGKMLRCAAMPISLWMFVVWWLCQCYNENIDVFDCICVISLYVSCIFMAVEPDS